jgi:predicted nucleotidyltransferase
MLGATFDRPELRAHRRCVELEWHRFVGSYRDRWAKERAEAEARASSLRQVAASLADSCREYGASRVRLFGSAAKGATRPGGDIDLAVEGVPPARFLDLYGALLLASAVSVDLVDMADCPDGLRERIDREGIDL